MPTPRLFGLRRTTSQQGSGVLDIPVDERSEQGASSARGTPRGGTPRLSSNGSDGLQRRDSASSGAGPARGVMLDEVRLLTDIVHAARYIANSTAIAGDREPERQCQCPHDCLNVIICRGGHCQSCIVLSRLQSHSGPTMWGLHF